MEIINILDKFRNVDKYEAFGRILPEVRFAAEEQKEIISAILDTCCGKLIESFQAARRPTKPALKQILVYCMDEIALAPVNAANREFGYQLGWYLAEKANVNLRKGTEKKVWGYWSVEANEVRPPVRPRNSAKKKKETAAEAFPE